jgi:hypothetical protein
MAPRLASTKPAGLLNSWRLRHRRAYQHESTEWITEVKCSQSVSCQTVTLGRKARNLPAPATAPTTIAASAAPLNPSSRADAGGEGEDGGDAVPHEGSEAIVESLLEKTYLGDEGTCMHSALIRSSVLDSILGQASTRGAGH